MLTSLAVFSGGIAVKGGSGDSLLTPAPTVIAADAADVMTAEKVHSGIVQYTGFTAGRNLTTDTAANYTLAFPDMDAGDSLIFIVSITTAFAGTWVAGVGVTLAGRATVLANTFQIVVLTKTSATAWVLRAL